MNCWALEAAELFLHPSLDRNSKSLPFSSLQTCGQQQWSGYSNNRSFTDRLHTRRSCRKGQLPFCFTKHLVQGTIPVAVQLHMLPKGAPARWPEARGPWHQARISHTCTAHGQRLLEETEGLCVLAGLGHVCTHYPTFALEAHGLPGATACSSVDGRVPALHHSATGALAVESGLGSRKRQITLASRRRPLCEMETCFFMPYAPYGVPQGWQRFQCPFHVGTASPWQNPWLGKALMPLQHQRRRRCAR